MKNVIFSLSTVFIMLGIVLSKQALAGNGASGGSYKYHYTSGRYLENIKSYLFNAINDLPQAELDALSDKYKDKMHDNKSATIDWQKFVQYIKDTKGDDGSTPNRGTNPAGYNDVLFLTYKKNPAQLIALDAFYERFDKKRKDLTVDDSLEIARLLAHEASHLFGIGTKNDDEVSVSFSTDLMNLANRFWYRCSKVSTTMNLADCKYSRNDSGRAILGDNIIRLRISNTKFGEDSRRPAICQKRADIWRARFDFVSINEYDTAHTHIASLAPVTATELKDQVLLDFNLVNMQAGDIVVIQSGCFDFNTDGGIDKNRSLKFSITDTQNEPLFDDSKWSVDIKTRLTYLKFTLMKTDAGKFVLYGDYPVQYLNTNF